MSEIKADWGICTGPTLKDDLAAQIKSGHLADAEHLFKECIPLRSQAAANARQTDGETKNQVAAVQDGASTENQTAAANKVNKQVAEKLGLKSGQKTGLEQVIADLQK